jgi:hypothetical protein
MGKAVLFWRRTDIGPGALGTRRRAGLRQSRLDSHLPRVRRLSPFCNTFPILRTPEYAGASLSLDTAFIDGAALTVARSSQRYDRQGPGRLRYVDLGLSGGFEADLVVDEAGLVLTYEHLFERLTPSRID